MSRKLRIEFPGVVYLAMNPGMTARIYEFEVDRLALTQVQL
jgi:hypothetical protein